MARFQAVLQKLFTVCASRDDLEKHAAQGQGLIWHGTKTTSAAQDCQGTPKTVGHTNVRIDAGERAFWTFSSCAARVCAALSTLTLTLITTLTCHRQINAVHNIQVFITPTCPFCTPAENRASTRLHTRRPLY